MKKRFTVLLVILGVIVAQEVCSATYYHLSDGRTAVISGCSVDCTTGVRKVTSPIELRYSTRWAPGFTSVVKADKKVLSENHGEGTVVFDVAQSKADHVVLTHECGGVTLSAEFAVESQSDMGDLTDGVYTQVVDGIEWTFYVDKDGASLGQTSSRSVIPTTTEGNVAIPSVLGGKAVVAIGPWAFVDCRKLTSVTVPSSVKRIDWGVFHGCAGLKSVYIPASVTYIDSYAFSWCPSLMSIVVNDDNPNYKTVGGMLMTKDGKCLVHGINGDVKIPEGTIRIGENAFEGHQGLTSVTMPTSVREIGEDAFSYCGSLVLNAIPSGVVDIGIAAFYGCALEDVAIPSSVTNIGCEVFSGSSVRSITVDRNNSFYKSANGMLLTKDGCTLVQGVCGEVVIPDGVKAIGECAFWGLSDLTSITLPAGVTEIGFGAFCCCSVQAVQLPSGVESIAAEAFNYCGEMVSLTLPSSVMDIGDAAFWGCDKLQTIYIAEGDEQRVRGLLKEAIEDDALSRISFVEYAEGPIKHSVTFDLGVYGTRTGGGLLTQSVEDGTTAVAPTFTVANGWKFTGWDKAFDNVTSDLTVSALYENALPLTVYEDIDEAKEAAIRDGKLIFLLSGATWCGWTDRLKEYIADAGSAFADNYVYLWHDQDEDPFGIAATSSVPEFWIFQTSEFDLETKDTWDETALYVCRGCPTQYESFLSVINWCAESKPTEPDVKPLEDGYGYTEVIGDCTWTFSVINGEVEIGVRNQYGGVQCQCAVSPSPTGMLKVPEILGGRPVVSLGYYALHGLSSVTTVVLPSSLKEIGKFALRGCRRIASMEIPSNVAAVGYDALAGCDALFVTVSDDNRWFSEVDGVLYDRQRTDLYFWPRSRPIELPNTLRNIRSNACSDNFAMENAILRIPVGVTNIADNAFDYCQLSGVELNEGLLSIGWCAFADNERLSSIVIPSTVNTLENDVFYGCTNLFAVYFNGNAPRNADLEVYNGTPEDMVSFVRPRSTGWATEGSAALPDAWPVLDPEDPDYGSPRMISFWKEEPSPVDPYSPPEWTVVTQPETIIGYFVVSNAESGVFVETPSSKLAVFAADGECRGIAGVIDGPLGRLFSLSIGIADKMETGLTLKCWDAATETAYDVSAYAIDAATAGDQIGRIVAPVTVAVGVAKDEPDPEQEELTVYEDLDQAKEAAIRDGKLVFLVSGAMWCRYTTQLQQYIVDAGSVFTDSYVYLWHDQDEDAFGIAATSTIPEFWIFQPSELDLSSKSSWNDVALHVCEGCPTQYDYFLAVLRHFAKSKPEKGIVVSLDADGRAFSYGQTVTVATFAERTDGYTNVVCRGWLGAGDVPASGVGTQVTFVVTQPSELKWLYETNYWFETADAGGSATVREAGFDAEGSGCWVPAGTNVVVAADGDMEMFRGWRDELSGKMVADEASVVLDLTMDRAYRLSPVFGARATTVVAFDANGGVGADVACVATWGRPLPALSATSVPSRRGYDFLGYFDAATGGKQYYAADKSAIVEQWDREDESLALFAQWRARAYVIRFDANGGGGEMDDLRGIVYDAHVRLPTCAFANGNMRFSGWATTPDGRWAYSDGASVSNLTDIDGEVVTLYAVWNDTAEACFEESDGQGNEGATFDLVVFGGNVESAASVRLYIAYQTATVADFDLKKGTVRDGQGAIAAQSLKFPLTLNWAKGDTEPKTITIPVKADKTVEADETLVFQLADARGMELGGQRLCKVTIHDPGYDALEAKVADGTASKSDKSAWDKLQKNADVPYVAGLADPANGGKATGGGYCAANKNGIYKTASLKATPSKGYWFMGWYDSDGNFCSADLAFKVTPEDAQSKDYIARFVEADTRLCGTYNGLAHVNLKGMTLVKGADTSADVFGDYAFTATLSTAGKISGSVTVGGKKVSFKGDTCLYLDEDSAEFKVTLNEKTWFGKANAETLDIWILHEDSLQAIGEGQEEGFHPLAGEGGWSVSAYKAIGTDKASLAKVAKFVGTYSVYVPDDEGGLTAFALTVDAKGKAKVSGKFRDGTAIAYSGTMGGYDEYESSDGWANAYVYLSFAVKPKSLGSGSCGVSLWIAKPLDGSPDDGACPASVQIATYTKDAVKALNSDAGTIYPYVSGCWIPEGIEPSLGKLVVESGEESVEIALTLKKGVVTGIGKPLSKGYTVKFDNKTGLFELKKGKEYVVHGVFTQYDLVVSRIEGDGTFSSASAYL